MTSGDITVELLELVVEGGGRLDLEEASRRLNIPKEEVFKALQDALSRGLLYRVGEGYRLTAIGEDLLTAHREEGLHKLVHRYVHETKADRVRDWNSHWLRTHRLGRAGLEFMRSSLRSLPARIEEVVPLTALPEGARGIVVYLYGGRGLVRRLTDMGLTPGVEVTVVRKGFLRGPVQIAVRGTSLALGYGVARRVLVRRV